MRVLLTVEIGGDPTAKDFLTLKSVREFGSLK